MRVSPRGGLGAVLPVLGTFQGVAALPVGRRMPVGGFLEVGWCDCMWQKLKPAKWLTAFSGDFGSLDCGRDLRGTALGNAKPRNHGGGCGVTGYGVVIA